MPTNSEIIRSFCAAWAKLDPEQVLAYFTDDEVYHNMPGPPLVGIAAVRAGVERFLKGWQATTWDVLNIAAAGGCRLHGTRRPHRFGRQAP